MGCADVEQQAGLDSGAEVDSDTDRFDSVVLSELYEVSRFLEQRASTQQRRVAAGAIYRLLRTTLVNLNDLLGDTALRARILELLENTTTQEIPRDHISMWSYFSDVFGHLR
jgi:hypothetical protein